MIIVNTAQLAQNGEPQTATSASEKAMAGVGEHYYELHAGRRGHAAADEAMLRAVTFIRKLGERAHFSQDEHGTRIILERVTQNQHAMDFAVGRLRNEGWSIRVRAILAEDFQPLTGHLSISRVSRF